jgi:hypothetical protein
MSASGIAQEANYVMTEPLDISKAGWNKVLQMKNGNTMLFHFEPRKSILVKVFDKDHKEIATKKHPCELVDINAFERSWFDGLVEINNEAVLFLTQEVENKQTVCRLRFNSTTGGLIKEDKVVQSKSFTNKTISFLIKHNNSDNYYFACDEKDASGEKVDITLKSYNANHNLLKDVNVPLNIKGYDKTYLRSTHTDEKGNILLAIIQEKIVQYPDVISKFLTLAYLPVGESEFVTKTIDLSSTLSVKNVDIQSNSFFNKFNIYLTLSKSHIDRSSIVNETQLTTQNIFIIVDHDWSNTTYTPINGKRMNAELVKETDADHKVGVMKADFNTGSTGISTVCYLGSQYKDGEFDKANDCYVVEQYNERGEDVWAKVLPAVDVDATSKFPTVFQGYTSEGELSQTTFISSKRKYMILFNDVDAEFDKTLKSQVHKIHPNKNTNAVYYTVKKREASKKYLFGQPDGKVFNHIYSGSTNFDEQTNTLAVLVRSKSEKSDDIKLAWVKLED